MKPSAKHTPRSESWPFPNIRKWEMDGEDDVLRIHFVRELTLDEVKAMPKALADLYRDTPHKPGPSVLQHRTSCVCGRIENDGSTSPCHGEYECCYLDLPTSAGSSK